jgi:SEC-C motif
MICTAQLQIAHESCGVTKTGRNALCPCGSGRKYKKCCADARSDRLAKETRRASSRYRDMDLMLKRHEASELIRTQQQGLGRPIVAGKLGGHQLVAAGNTIYYSAKWRFFPDFLSDYIRGILSPEWGNAEIAKPFKDRHTIMQWYDQYCRFQRMHEKQPDGSYVATTTGIVCCYLGLAYNVFLIKHNLELQNRLVNRLKNQKQFQGAYYELIIANCLIRAGFDLKLEDEADASSKHCEFSAVSKRTGKRYWVEAKMRGVAGLLGKSEKDGAAPDAKPTSKLSDHLRDALSKPAGDDRLVFIDVNAPPLHQIHDATGQYPAPEWAEAAERRLRARERDLKDGEQAYVFVTNMAFHRALDEEARGHSVLIYGLGIPDFGKGGQYRLSDLWRQKQKHIDDMT